VVSARAGAAKAKTASSTRTGSARLISSSLLPLVEVFDAAEGLQAALDRAGHRAESCTLPLRTLRLPRSSPVRLPSDAILVIQYGHAGFDGCEEPNRRGVDVNGMPGAIIHRNAGGSRLPYATVIWPVLGSEFDGRYGITGYPAKPKDVLRLARGMDVSAMARDDRASC
jgi:hypothetical protein